MNSFVLLVAIVGAASAGFIPRSQPQVFQPRQFQPQFTSPPVFPVDCQYSAWTEYSQCSEPCGKQGTQARTRTILSQPKFGGKECDPSLLEEWRPCLVPCAQDCVMGPWSQYSQCQSLTGQNCGAGQRQRTRSILIQAANGGQPCQHQSEKEPCSLGPCAVDCVMGAWTQYSQCTTLNGQTCGIGQQSRTRPIIVQPKNGGQPCGQQFDSKSCDLGPCAQNCEMTLWTQWSQCQSSTGQSCGFGQRQRTRQVLKQALNGGIPCGEPEEWEACNLGPCAVDCVMGPWSEYSQCQSSNGLTCGFGQQSRTRSILVQPQNGGKPCERTFDSISCNLGPCAQDCVMSLWTPWSQCQTRSEKSCGFGQRQRTRSILTQPLNGGAPCGEQEEWEACNAGPCPIDCVMGEWGQYGQCSAKCGGGLQTRSRPILVQPQFGGRQCLPTTESIPCGQQPCFNPPSCIGRPIEFYINPAEPCSPTYWKCVNQETLALTCPSGHMFDIQSFKCLPRFQVAACQLF